MMPTLASIRIGIAPYRTRVLLLSTSTRCFSALCPRQMNATDEKNNVLRAISIRNTSFHTQQNQHPGESKTVLKEARIICISDPQDDANNLLYREENLKGASAKVLAIGSTMEDFDLQRLSDQKANVIFVSEDYPREPLAGILDAIPSIEWVHCRCAGLDHVMSDTFASSNVAATNVKGCFSSPLAEYTMMAISYFAKDLPRLLRQKSAKNWEKYQVEEIKGKSLGIVGYGDIGQNAARLAKAYGMVIKALRRNPQKSKDDPIIDEVYPSDRESLHRIMSECDYVLCAAPLTPETRGLFDKEAFDNCKKEGVFINIGRGPIVDENALIDALRSGNLKGAALDVFAIEPLPLDSEFWTLDNVLLSPHHMDYTANLMHEATAFFVQENLPRFVRGMDLLNQVNLSEGY